VTGFETSFAALCLEALEIALAAGRKPKIFHSHQGIQFTSTDFVSRLQDESTRISWSGRKRCYDNILVERPWRTVKYVAEGFSAKPSRDLPTCLQRWLGG
jgi:transposase InsO family protein